MAVAQIHLLAPLAMELWFLIFMFASSLLSFSSSFADLAGCLSSPAVRLPHQPGQQDHTEAAGLAGWLRSATCLANTLHNTVQYNSLTLTSLTGSLRLPGSPFPAQVGGCFKRWLLCVCVCFVSLTRRTGSGYGCAPKAIGRRPSIKINSKIEERAFSFFFFAYPLLPYLKGHP